MSTHARNWLSPKQFARRIDASVHFVHKRINSGEIPYRCFPGRGRLVNRCHISKFRPYLRHTKLFSVEDVIAETGLLKQTICDLLKKREVRYTCSDGNGHYMVKCIQLDATRPIKRWLIPEATRAALLDAVQPNRAGWPPAVDVAHRMGASTAYVLRLFQSGYVRGQQSIIRQRVHIHPVDAAKLEYDGEHRIPISEVSATTGLAVQTIADIVRRGYFTQRRTGPQHDVVTERIPVYAEKRLKRYWFTHEGMMALVQGVSPHLMHWPTAVAIERCLSLGPGTVSRYFNNGQIRGCTSIKGQGQRLHVHPFELRAFVLQKKYNLADVAERVGFAVTTLIRWNKEATQPFLGHGLGRQRYVPPHVVGRMLMIKAYFGLGRGALDMLALPGADIRKAIQTRLLNGMCYDSDRPPSICECKKGMRVILSDHRVGRITAVKPYPYRPAIEIYFPDEKRTYAYAVAK